MADIKSVAFDKDGTLFDSERLYGESLIKTCTELGYQLTDSQRKEFVGLAAEKTFALLEKYIGQDFDRKKMLAMWFRYRDELIESGGLNMMPGAEHALRYCYKQGYPIALVTSDNHDGVLHDFGHSAEDLLSLFSVVITIDDVVSSKPNPEPYLRAAAYLGVEPEEMLVIEDSVHGAEAALAAGCPLALYPAHAMPSHITDQALLVLKRIDDIEGILS